MRTALLIVLAAVGAPLTARAQCRPPKSSNEAKLLAFYSVPVVFTADPSAVTVQPRPVVTFSVEGDYVPTASAALQHTEFCYTGRAQHTGLTSFFGRPRLALSLPSGVGLELSYLPAITIAQATPNLLSGAISLTRDVASETQLILRVHATTGSIKGPITCPKESLQQQDASAPCYGTTQSTDEFRPQMIGEEVLLRRSGSSSRVSLFGGVGTNELMPRFRVGFSDLSGGTDHTTILVNLTRFTALVGGTLRVAGRCAATVEGYSSLTDVATVRGFFSCTP